MYPYGSTTLPKAQPDLPYTILQRRQGDVKATLIPITLNGQPVNIAGYEFVFSVTLPGGVQEVTWTVQAPTTGNPITSVASPFTVPSFNSTVSVTVGDTSQFTSGNQILVSNFGVYSVETVISPTIALLLNTGLFGNLSSGVVTDGTAIFQLGQVGMTVLVIPSTITSVSVGLYPYFMKYDTSDPPPGPYKNTFLQGALQILPQNDSNA